MLLTFIIVCIGWIFFRANTLADVWHILGRIAADALKPETYFVGVIQLQDRPAGNFLLLALVLFVVVEWVQRRRSHPLALTRWPGAARWAAYFALSVAIVFTGTFSGAQFIYFQF